MLCLMPPTTAFKATFLQVLLVTREARLLCPGTVSINGIKIDAEAARPAYETKKAADGPSRPTTSRWRQSYLTDPGQSAPAAMGRASETIRPSMRRRRSVPRDRG